MRVHWLMRGSNTVYRPESATAVLLSHTPVRDATRVFTTAPRPLGREDPYCHSKTGRGNQVLVQRTPSGLVAVRIS